MQIHSPDIIGPVDLSGAPGTAGDVLTSAGAGAQAVWSTLATIPGIFKGTSASNVTHTITHNLNNQYPDVTIYDTGTGAEVIPATVVGTSVNVLTVTFFSATAIAFTIVG